MKFAVSGVSLCATIAMPNEPDCSQARSRRRTPTAGSAADRDEGRGLMENRRSHPLEIFRALLRAAGGRFRSSFNFTIVSLALGFFATGR
jgi:hypothetical protein